MYPLQGEGIQHKGAHAMSRRHPFRVELMLKFPEYGPAYVAQLPKAGETSFFLSPS